MSWPPPNYRPDYGTGYRVTFEDFQQLISNPQWQSGVVPLLRDWFQYEIAGERRTAVVRSADGQVIDLEALHQRIQADPQKQYELYQNAMDLWR
jgi:hypothetical protein